MVLDLALTLTVFVVAVFVLTQIAIPLWHNTPLFPAFRKGREKKLEAELKAANQEIENLKLQLELKDVKAEAEKLRRKAEGLTETSNGATEDEAVNK